MPAPTLSRLLGTWALDPGVISLNALAALLYLYGAWRTRRRWPLLRCCSFIAGLAALVAALDSGIDGASAQLLSVHMLQHLLLMLVAPILLLYGAPLRLALAASSPALRRALGGVLRSRAARALASPAVGFTAFAVVVLSMHLTGLFELALRNRSVHALEHAAYFWSGVILLAPLIAADPLPHPPGPVARFAWLTGAMVVMAIPGALLTWGMTVRYRSYLAGRALHRSALADQHLAGVLMWIGGGALLFVLAVTVAMSAMLAEERRQRRREAAEDARRARTAAAPVDELEGARA